MSRMPADVPVSPRFVRAMRPSDVPAVMEIEARAYPFPWTAGIFRDCLRVGYHCQVYAVEQLLYGYAVWSAAVGEAHLLNLCVAPSWQGRGIGRLLLRELMTEAADGGAQMLFLEVRPSNPHAMRLYESMGFNEIDRRRNYYPAHNGREDAVVMACQL